MQVDTRYWGTDKGRRAGSKTGTDVTRLDGRKVVRRRDQLATEEPLEIRLSAGGKTQTVAVTMRTPGADFELAAGFLHAEGIMGDRAEIAGIAYCLETEAEQRYNIVTVTLRGEALPELGMLERHFTTTSACGVCGKASLEALQIRGCTKPTGKLEVSPELLGRLPDKLRETQGLFEVTGGLHAAALFDNQGELVALREDVGRHNALDKLVGWAFLEGRLPLSDHIVLLSGRASFELLQKSLVAGVPVVCAISAPSSLAVAVARDFDMTLVGFLRGQRFNVYAGEARIDLGRPIESESH